MNVLKSFYLYLFPLELLLSGKLSEYGVIVPFSADCKGRFLSHVVSGSVASGSGEDCHPSTPHSARHRVARSTLNEPLHQGGAENRLLYFNVTVFGKELHLRVKPNHRLVPPGASAEWQEDFQVLFREPLQQECVFTGDISAMPGGLVAISNCDGLVSNRQFTLLQGKCFLFQYFTSAVHLGFRITSAFDFGSAWKKFASHLPVPLQTEV